MIHRNNIIISAYCATICNCVYCCSLSLSLSVYSLADCMRGMEFDAWLAMMDHLFQALLQHLQTVQVQYVLCLKTEEYIMYVLYLS